MFIPDLSLHGLSDQFCNFHKRFIQFLDYLDRMTFVASPSIYAMGLLTWMIIAVVILAVVGLGIGTFYSGILQGTQKIGSNTIVKNATDEAKQFVANVTNSATN